jgi:DNA-binding MarR family transcriptional regulator
LTWTTNFVNYNIVAIRRLGWATLYGVTKGLEMPVSARKHARWASATPARTGPSRNTPQVRMNVEKTIDLGGLNRHLGYFIRRVQVWVFQDFILTLKSLDISPAQYSVLLVIDTNPGLSQTELARTLGIQRARLVRMLHQLDKRGLTRRLQSSADGRTHALRLTQKGQETLRRAQELAEQHEVRLIDRIGAEPYTAVKNILRNF